MDNLITNLYIVPVAMQPRLEQTRHLDFCKSAVPNRNTLAHQSQWYSHLHYHCLDNRRCIL